MYTPTVRGRRLALELRRLRERSDLTLREAASRVGWAPSKLSRIESANARPTDDDVAALLQLYGLDHDKYAAALELNRNSWKRGWWTHYDGAFTGNYAMLEEQAPELSYFQLALVPGLLQTPDYARALLTELAPAKASDIDNLVAARMHRKHILDRSSPPKVHAIIDEAVVRRVVGDEDVMRKQISSLWGMAVERPNVTIQVVPFRTVVHSGLEGSFTVFTFPEEPGLDVAHSEDMLGERYAESSEAVAGARLAFAHVASAAMTPDESVEFLAALARE